MKLLHLHLNHLFVLATLFTFFVLPGDSGLLFGQTPSYTIESDETKGTQSLVDLSSGKPLFKNCQSITPLELNDPLTEFYLIVSGKTIQVFHANTKTTLVKANVKNNQDCFQIKKYTHPGKQIIVLFTVDGRRTYALGSNGIVYPKNQKMVVDDIRTLEGTDAFLAVGVMATPGEYTEGVLDWDGQEVVPPGLFTVQEYDQTNQLFIVKQKEMYGVIGKGGTAIFPPEYTFLSCADGFYVAEKDNWVGVITPKKTILPFKFKRDPVRGHKPYYKNGVFNLVFENEEIALDTSSKTIQKVWDFFKTYKSASYYAEKCTIVYADRKFSDEEVVAHVVNNDTKQITIPSTYILGIEHVPHLLSGGVGVIKDGKLGVANMETGAIMIPLEYEPVMLKEIAPGSNHLDQAFQLNWFKRDRTDIAEDPVVIIMKKNGKFGIIDIKGQVLVPFIYEQIVPNSSCLQRDLLLIKKDGLFGLMDKNTFGVKIECQYEYIFDCKRAKKFKTDKEEIDLKIGN